jgi:hypothetical protein
MSRKRPKQRKLMDKERAEMIAMTFLLDTTGREAKLIGARKSETEPHEWVVIFETTSKDGGVIEGGTIVIVDERSAKARFFPAL